MRRDAACHRAGPFGALPRGLGERPPPQLLAEAASVAKALASEAAIDVTSSAIQAHGGIGFTWEADVHWLYKRAQMNAQLMGGAGEHRRRLAQVLDIAPTG